MVEAAITLAILALAVFLFVSEKLRVDVVALGVVVVLMLTGLLTPAEALAGFSNSAVLTITALFVVGGAVMKTGLADLIGQRVLRLAGGNQKRLLVLLMLTVALLSSVMSDTGTVAVLLPVTILLARSSRISSAQLLIPLALGSLLGGGLTLIGTPPNVIVADLLAEAGYESFGFFDYTPIGFLLLLAGILFIALLGSRLLPKRTERPLLSVDNFNQLIEDYHLMDEVSRLRIRQTSPLAGKQVRDSQLRSLFDVNILKIMRPSSEADGHALPLMPDADSTLQPEDILIVKGEPANVHQASLHWRLGVQPPKPKDIKALLGREVGVVEAVIRPRSAINGKTIAEVDLGNRFQVTLLGLNRPGSGYLDDNLGDIPLRVGDTLLLQGSWSSINQFKKENQDVVVLGEPEAMLAAAERHNINRASVILAIMIIFLMTGWLPVATVTLTAALLMVLSGCLTMDEAYRNIDWKSVVLIAGMLPLSTALIKSGLVDSLANTMVVQLGEFGPVVVMAAFFLLTSVFTQLISNTATTVIVAPIALQAATQLGVLPQAFLMTVAISASMAFATPVASPVNTMVMGPGGYQFKDYLRVGIPLLLIIFILTLILVPLRFPFS